METDSSLNQQMNQLVCALINYGITREEAVDHFKKIFTVQVLARSKGNQCKAARELGVHRNTLSREIKQSNIDVKKASVAFRSPMPSRSVSVERIAKAG
jgi:transcriptional regulator with GAF, ATPase, and Fis domain